MPAPISASFAVSRPSPTRSISASTSIKGHLDLVQEPLHPELPQARALAAGELAGEPGVDRRVACHVTLRGREAELTVVGARGRRRETRVCGQLVKVVGAPRGVDQVGGDHGVVGQVEALRAGAKP